MLITETNASIGDASGLQILQIQWYLQIQMSVFLLSCDFVVLHSKVDKDPPESTYTHACFHAYLLEFLSMRFQILLKSVGIAHIPK